jgi:HlyD family secretion protein
MDPKKKAQRVGIVFLVLLIIGGIVLLYRGNDAVALGVEKKEGILTAEQVKMSFDSVGGRLLHVHVKEGDEVKKGDVIMEIDPTDTELSIKKLEAQIAQIDAQTAGKGVSQQVSFEKADSDETQSLRQIDQQRAAVASAQATLANSKLDYDRKAALVSAGAIAQSQMDDASTALEVAQANVTQQQELLSKLLSGAQDNGDGTVLPEIAQARTTAANMGNDITALVKQKEALQAELEQLKVNKDRLVLRAPEDGKVLKVLSKEGEMVTQNTPVVLLESNRSYYDIYISEKQAAHLQEGDTITGTTVAGKKKVPGTVKLLMQAPSFADLKQSREKGQADLSAFQVRIYIDPVEGVKPGMTIGVSDREFSER